MRRNYVPAEAIVDNVVRKLDFLEDHPGWEISCVNHTWYARNREMEYQDRDLGLLMDRVENVAKAERR